MMHVLFIIIGFTLLAFGGEWLVRASMSIARKMKLSALLVSVVIIGFGTSVPELLVSVDAALKGAPDIALGNVVGSNICNTLLILGVAAAIMPISCRTTTIKSSVLMNFFSSGLLAILSLTGEIDRLSGFLMLTALAGYLVYSVRSDRRKTAQSRKIDQQLLEHIEEEVKGEEMPVSSALLLAVFSLALLLTGAHMLVTGAVSMSRQFGLSEAFIGLTLVAVGTSLPELATAVMASLRGRSDIVIGNVLGSNLFNVLGILGITSLIKPFLFAGQIASQDVWIMLGTAVLLGPVVLPGRVISRMEGFIFLGLYSGYIFWLYANSG